MERYVPDLVEPERAELIVRLVPALVHKLNNALAVIQSALDLGDGLSREDAAQQSRLVAKLLAQLAELTLPRRPFRERATLEGCLEPWFVFLRAVGGQHEVAWRPHPAGSGLVELDLDAFAKGIVGLAAAVLCANPRDAMGRSAGAGLTLETQRVGERAVLVLEGPDVADELIDAARSEARAVLRALGGQLNSYAHGDDVPCASPLPHFDRLASGRRLDVVELPSLEPSPQVDSSAAPTSMALPTKDGLRLAFVDRGGTGSLLRMALDEEVSHLTDIELPLELTRAVAANALDLVVVDLGEIPAALDVLDLEAFAQAAAEVPLAVLTPAGTSEQLEAYRTLEHPVTPAALFELISSAARGE